MRGGYYFGYPKLTLYTILSQIIKEFSLFILHVFELLDLSRLINYQEDRLLLNQRLLNISTRAFGSVLFIALIVNYALNAFSPASIIQVSIALLMCLISYLTSQRGYVKFSSFFFPFTLWLNIATVIAFSGGVHNPLLFLLLIPILLFGALLGSSVAAVFALLSSVEVISLLLIDLLGLYVSYFPFDKSPIVVISMAILLYIMISVYQRLLMIVIDEVKLKSEWHFKSTFDNTPVSLWELDFSGIYEYLEGNELLLRDDLDKYLLDHQEIVEKCYQLMKIVDFNRATLELFEAESKEELFERFDEIFPNDAESVLYHAILAIQKREFTLSMETKYQTLKGKQITAFIHSAVSQGHDEDYSKIITTVFDLTELKEIEDEKNRLEELVRHEQKLQSLGLLAGEIAHDINNLLTAIQGNAILGLGDIENSKENLEGIMNITNQAAELTNNLLAYSGRGRFKIQKCCVSTIVDGMLPIFRLSAGPNVEITIDQEDDLPLIEADIGQLKQVILNLVTNACEAVSSNGKVSIRTGTTGVDSNYNETNYAMISLIQGEYVTLEVSDTGSGINDENLKKIFDPFFTTKETGRGLGLAVVVGIVRAHHGAITVQTSEMGTTFRVLFPVSADQEEKTKKPVKQPFEHNGRVLLIDDELIIRKIGKKMLENIGYEVMTAEDGIMGVEMFKSIYETIDLVIVDLTMPKMDGVTTLKQLREINKEVPILISSGYDKNDTLNRFSIADDIGYLQKPYTLEELKEEITTIKQQS